MEAGWVATLGAVGACGVVGTFGSNASGTSLGMLVFVTPGCGACASGGMGVVMAGVLESGDDFAETFHGQELVVSAGGCAVCMCGPSEGTEAKYGTVFNG